MKLSPNLQTKVAELAPALATSHDSEFTKLAQAFGLQALKGGFSKFLETHEYHQNHVPGMQNSIGKCKSVGDVEAIANSHGYAYLNRQGSDPAKAEYETSHRMSLLVLVSDLAPKQEVDKGEAAPRLGATDPPGTRCVFTAHPTKSQVVYSQSIGRGPEIE
jgi:hypothetical protein